MSIPTPTSPLDMAAAATRMKVAGAWGDFIPTQVECSNNGDSYGTTVEIEGDFFLREERDYHQVLAEVGELLSGGRQKDYGAPLDSHKRIAAIWSAQLGITVTPRKVAMMMAGLKLARLAESPDHDDSWRDALGYLALGSSFPEAQA